MKKFDDAFSCFDRISACDKRTDERPNEETDRRTDVVKLERQRHKVTNRAPVYRNAAVFELIGAFNPLMGTGNYSAHRII